MEIEYTRIKLIHEVNNDKAHNFYYMYQGRIYNDDRTEYRRFKYIQWFDIFDVQEFYDEDVVTKQDIEDFADQLECGYLYNIRGYNDEKGLQEFYDYCNETIEDYNRVR